MKKIIAFIAVAMPTLVLAQGTLNNVNDVSKRILDIGNLFTYLLIALAVIYIIWNVVKYMIKPAEDDRKVAGQAILYGIVGLFVILSIWGLVNILVGTFRTNVIPPTMPNQIPRGSFPTVPL